MYHVTYVKTVKHEIIGYFSGNIQVTKVNDCQYKTSQSMHDFQEYRPIGKSTNKIQNKIQ